MPTNNASSLSGLLASNVVSAEVIRLLADRNSPAILNHPAFVRAADIRASGSATVTLAELGLDAYDILAPQADGALLAPTSLTIASVNLSPSPFRKAYEITDLARAVDTGRLSPDVLARDAVVSVTETVISLIAALASGFSQTTNNSGSALTLANFQSAKSALGARKVPGPYLAILSGVQWGHLEASMMTATGTVSYLPATQAALLTTGSGYKGKVLDVDVFVSNRVASVSSDHAACMFGRGAIAWAAGSFAPEVDPNILDFGGSMADGGVPFRFERIRTGLAGKTAWATSAQLAVSEVIDLAGQYILSKNTV